MASGDYPSVFLSGDFTQAEQIDTASRAFCYRSTI